MSKTASVFVQINEGPVMVFSKDQETTKRFNNLRFKAKETCSEFLDEELEENLVSAFPKPCAMSSMTELCDLIKSNLKTKIDMALLDNFADGNKKYVNPNDFIEELRNSGIDDSFAIQVLPKTNNPIVHRTKCVKITKVV